MYQGGAALEQELRACIIPTPGTTRQSLMSWLKNVSSHENCATVDYTHTPVPTEVSSLVGATLREEAKCSEGLECDSAFFPNLHVVDGGH